MKYVLPSVHQTAFNCPHCEVLTTQYWFPLRSDRVSTRDRLPIVISEDEFDEMARKAVEGEEEDYKRKMAWASMMLKGYPFLQIDEHGPLKYWNVYNLSMAKCPESSQVSLWLVDRLIYPRTGRAPPANPDISDDIKCDDDEANSTLDLSPRGAAALLRLARQKLCKELGQSGENIDHDIAALVNGGLPKGVADAMVSSPVGLGHLSWFSLVWFRELVAAYQTLGAAGGDCTA